MADILPGCTKFGELEHGIEIHQRVIECGLIFDVKVVITLIGISINIGCPILTLKRGFNLLAIDKATRSMGLYETNSES